MARQAIANLVPPAIPSETPHAALPRPVPLEPVHGESGGLHLVASPQGHPQEYVTQHPDKKVRVTAKDEQGGWNTKAGVVLTGVRFAGDSVLGRDRKGQPFALSLQQVGAIEVRGKDGLLTGLLVVALVPLVLFGVVMVVCAIQGGTCIGD